MKETYPGPGKPDNTLIEIYLDGEHYPVLGDMQTDLPNPNYVLDSDPDE